MKLLIYQRKKQPALDDEDKRAYLESFGCSDVPSYAIRFEHLTCEDPCIGKVKERCLRDDYAAKSLSKSTFSIHESCTALTPRA